MSQKETGPGGAECCLDPSDQDARARNRLLRAAVDIFERKGYAAASVREIVEQAGLTKPALYYHFGSKEGVLLAILQTAGRELEAAVGRALESNGTARERLTILCDEVYHLFVRNVPVIRVAHAVYFGPREAMPPFDFRSLDRALIGGIARIAEEGVRSGELRPAPAEDYTLAIQGIIISCFDREVHGMGMTIGPDGLRRVLALVFDGLAASKTATVASPAAARA